jgi:hypothetical protein
MIQEYDSEGVVASWTKSQSADVPIFAGFSLESVRGTVKDHHENKRVAGAPGWTEGARNEVMR